MNPNAHLIDQLLVDGAGCAKCPMARAGEPGSPVGTWWDHAHSPPVALIAEAPGKMETRWGKPLIGPSGKLLDLACAQAGIPRGDTFAILNAAACGPIPSYDTAMKEAAVAACRPRLLAELGRLKPKVVLTVGAFALKAVADANVGKVTTVRGALVPLAEDVARLLVPAERRRLVSIGGSDADHDSRGVPGRKVLLWSSERNAPGDAAIRPDDQSVHGGRMAPSTRLDGVTFTVPSLRGGGSDRNAIPLIPTLHPAHILRGGDGEQQEGGESHAVDLLYYFFLADIAKAARLASGEIATWRDTCELYAYLDDTTRGPKNDRPEGLYRIDYENGTDRAWWGEPIDPAPLVAGLLRLEQSAQRIGKLGGDTETTGRDNLSCTLTAIGMATGEFSISVSWSALLHVPEALEIVRRILADPALIKVFHNKPYDEPVLSRHGLPMGGRVEDTLLRHHAAFPGLKHELQGVAQQFFVVRAWKEEFRRGTRSAPHLLIYNARDATAAFYLDDPLAKMIEVRKTQRVYEADRQLATVARHMREVGYFVDRKEQARHSGIQHARLAWMREQLVRDLAGIEDPFRRALAEVLAAKPRKKEIAKGLGYAERVELRYEEIGRVRRKKPGPNDIGLFKPKAKQDLVALFRVLEIPITSYTLKGAPVTDKKAMETAAKRHPLMRRLIHVREAQNLLATFIDGLPIREDGRAHPDWKVFKITGRWSAGRSQNFVYSVAGWPPEEEIDPDADACGLRTPVSRSPEAVSVPDGLRLSLAGAEGRGGGAVLARGTPEAPQGTRKRLVGLGGGVGHGDRNGDLQRGGGDGAEASAAPAGPRPGYRWRTTASGELVAPRENPRTQISAPTVAEILALPEALVDPRIWRRAREGFGRKAVGADFSMLELRLAGYYSGEPTIIDNFAREREWDAHSHFARVCFSPAFGTIADEFIGLGISPKAKIAALTPGALRDYEQWARDVGVSDVEMMRVRLGALSKQWKRLRDLTKRCEYGAIYGGQPETLWDALVRDYPTLTLQQVADTVALIEKQMPGVVAQRNRWLNDARRDREIRDCFLGRARLFPLGYADPNICFNFPVQTAAASLLAFAIFRFVAITAPELLDLDVLYAHGLLDRAFVGAWRRKLMGRGGWRAPVELLLNGHDSLLAETDDEDAAFVRDLMEAAMTQHYTHPRGWHMEFPAEAAIGQRWSDT